MLFLYHLCYLFCISLIIYASDLFSTPMCSLTVISLFSFHFHLISRKLFPAYSISSQFYPIVDTQKLKCQNLHYYVYSLSLRIIFRYEINNQVDSIYFKHLLAIEISIKWMILWTPLMCSGQRDFDWSDVYSLKVFRCVVFLQLFDIVTSHCY